MAELSEIAKKIERLRKADGSFSLFGSDCHEYRLDPPLTEEEIGGFEQKHDIRLPADYREFLTTVGSSGAGPFYGLISPFNEDEHPAPSQPFPLTQGQAFHCQDAYDAMDDSLDEGEQENALDEIYSDVSSGLLYLAHEGCGMFSVLVVNGEDAGHVWFYDLANDAGIFPLAHPESWEPLTFLDWYSLWLDSALAQAEQGSGMFRSFADFIAQDHRYAYPEDDEEEPPEPEHYHFLPYAPALQFMGANFGQAICPSSLYDDGYLRFWTFLPTDRDYKVICSYGLGLFKFPGHEMRHEYFMVLPRDWDTDSQDDRLDWPLAVLAHICKGAAADGEILPVGATCDFEAAFADDTGFSAVVALSPEFLSRPGCALENGEKVEFLQLLPLYPQEAEKLGEGADEELTDKLKDKRGMVDISRPPLRG